MIEGEILVVLPKQFGREIARLMGEGMTGVVANRKEILEMVGNGVRVATESWLEAVEANVPLVAHGINFSGRVVIIVRQVELLPSEREQLTEIRKRRLGWDEG